MTHWSDRKRVGQRVCRDSNLEVLGVHMEARVGDWWKEDCLHASAPIAMRSWLPGTTLESWKIDSDWLFTLAQICEESE